MERRASIMTVAQLMEHTGAQTSDARAVAGITCDSRKVQPGWVFVCICGTSSDGHAFAKQALEAGAAAVVVQRDLGLAQQIRVESCAPTGSAGHPAACT